MKGQITPHFVKHIVVTDIILLLALLGYNLLSWLIPVNRIRLGAGILMFVIIDTCLVIIKLVNNFNFGANR
ncbi:hypothetical protein [[Lactobacillus] timonensis]|uniref:hypothetical protein n=1 Tax=[Lactobacillus] timonensis TaxID=1970790 RepID=UPI000C8248AB|nr:hypothetical protein [[Lactobacillus] timonensis]